MCISRLEEAMKGRWNEKSGIVAKVELTHFGELDVERPERFREIWGFYETVRVEDSTRRKESPSYIVGIVDLSEVESVEEQFGTIIKELQSTAHYVATHLPRPSWAEETYLWAVAPEGAADSSAWRNLRADVYQDSWSLQKSVWLPSKDVLSSVDDFLNESFLAAPWAVNSDSDESDVNDADLYQCLANSLSPKQKNKRSERTIWSVSDVKRLLDLFSVEEPTDHNLDQILEFIEDKARE